VFFNELEAMHGKVEDFRTLMGENDHLLGNFSAKRIAAIHDAKNAVETFVSESSKNVSKINEHSKYRIS
jgi:hypothetical protein